MNTTAPVFTLRTHFLAACCGVMLTAQTKSMKCTMLIFMDTVASEWPSLQRFFLHLVGMVMGLKLGACM